MTVQITDPLQTVHTAAPPRKENPVLDERLWRAWVEKNEKRDKVKFDRRVKVITIVVVLLAMAAFTRSLAGY